MVDTNYVGTLDRTTRISIAAKGTNAGDKLIDIGLVQSLNVSESRDVTTHYTLGNMDEPTALIPGLVTGRTISMEALAFFKQSIIGKFATSDTVGQFMYSLKQQTQPFEIHVTKQKAGSTTDFYTIVYGGCFFTNFNYDQSIGKGDVTIVEKASCVYQTVTSV